MFSSYARNASVVVVLTAGVSQLLSSLFKISVGGATSIVARRADSVLNIKQMLLFIDTSTKTPSSIADFKMRSKSDWSAMATESTRSRRKSSRVM